MSNDNHNASRKPKYRVAVLLPSMHGFTEETTISLVGVCVYALSQGIQINVLNESVTGVAKCRNALVSEALEHDFTHVFFIDADMFFPMTVLEQLLAHNKDIVGVPYVGRKLPTCMLGVPLHEPDRHKLEDLVEAETMPSGLILINTEVFRHVPQPWYFESYAYKGSKKQQFIDCLQDALGAVIPKDVIYSLQSNSHLKAWLKQPEHGKHGLTYDCSEDSNFTFKARRFGFKTWSDLSLAPFVGHVGKYVYGMKDLPRGERLDSESDVKEQGGAS